MNIFLDSSALVKLYIREDGTDRVVELCESAREMTVSVLCVAEVLSACNRLLREGLLDNSNYLSIKQQFLADLESASIIGVTADVLDYSIACLEKGSIRSLDSIQIGSALAHKCDIFITADIKQKNIADLMGLQVEIS